MERGFFLKQPFPFRPKPWDLPLPSYRLLPLSLAFHIFSFLPARISSAGHQHSFPTGSLCLDIPTPPSVLCNPASNQENQLFHKLATAFFLVFIPSNVKKKKKKCIHDLNTRNVFNSQTDMLLVVDIWQFSSTNHFDQQLGRVTPMELQPCSIQTRGRGCPCSDFDLESVFHCRLPVVRFCTGVR